MRHRIYYYRTEKGTSAVKDFLDSLPVKAAAKCSAYLSLLAERGLSPPSSIMKKVADGIWELRPEFGGTEYRLLFTTIADGAFLVVHAPVKKRQKIERQGIELAVKRAGEWRQRYGTRSIWRKP